MFSKSNGHVNNGLPSFLFSMSSPRWTMPVGEGQLKSSQFIFSKPSWGNKGKREQNKNQQNHALKKVAISQQNDKECLHQSGFNHAFTVSFNTHTIFVHFAFNKTTFKNLTSFRRSPSLLCTKIYRGSHASGEMHVHNVELVQTDRFFWDFLYFFLHVSS